MLLGAKKAAKDVALVSVLPRYDKSRFIDSKILSFNLRLEKMCKEIDANFIEVFSILTKRPEFYSDKLHINARVRLALERLCMEFFDVRPQTSYLGEEGMVSHCVGMLLIRTGTPK